MLFEWKKKFGQKSPKTDTVGPLGFKTLPILGRLQNLLLLLYFWGNISLPYDLNRIRISESPTFHICSDGPVIAVPWISEMDRYFWQRAPNHLLCYITYVDDKNRPNTKLSINFTNHKHTYFFVCTMLFS